MNCRNLIFDLYGTLADIQTDEKSLALWREMAKVYSVYGADYTPAALRDAFFRMDRAERAKLRRETGLTHVEIQLEHVFARVLLECPHKRMPDLSLEWPETEEALISSGWVFFVANLFRTLSRSHLRLYPGTAETLRRLRQRGIGLYLLSNAQAIFTRPELAYLDLPPLFDGMMLSSDYRVMKPEPVFMQTLLTQYAMQAAESIMVGNEFGSDADIALSCGMRCVILNTGRMTKRALEQKRAESLARHPGSAADDLLLIAESPWMPSLPGLLGIADVETECAEQP